MTNEEVPLENRRQDNKKLMGPAILMEIFGICLQIGKEKGYTDGSWKEYLTNGTDLTPSLSRHLIGVESGEVEYDELHPVTGQPLQTKGNHAYQLFWNAAVEAIREYNRQKQRKIGGVT